MRQRAALVADGAIVAARIVRDDDGLRPGLVAPAQLIEIVRKGALGARPVRRRAGSDAPPAAAPR